MPGPETETKLVWIRCVSQRASVSAHLRHLAGSFQAAGWRVTEGIEPPAPPAGTLAVIDDPWIEPLPEITEHLATHPRVAAARGSERWRVPRVFGLAGVQGWHPRHPPQSLRDYERVAFARRRADDARVGRVPAEASWSGFAVAAPGSAAALLDAGWPPAPQRLELVPGARLFRYADPAAHPRTELDPFIPTSTRLLVDVGCGHGLLGERFRGPERTVVGIEPDWPLAREAATRLDLVLPARAVEGLAALGHQADCIVLADVLEHTEDPSAVLRSVAAALAGNGKVVLSLPNAAYAPGLRALAAGRWDTTLAGVQARDHLTPMTPDSFARLAAECGLRVEHTQLLHQPLPLGLKLWAWLTARTAGGDPRLLSAPQWIVVLERF